MKSRRLVRWVLGLLALSCDGRIDLGPQMGAVGGSAGASESQVGVAGATPKMTPEMSGGGGVAGGSGGAGGGAVAGGSGGSAGSLPTGEPGCFEPRSASATPSGLALGPRNQVFAEVQTESNPLNYADQVVLTGLVWRINANYPSHPRAADATVDLPANLASVKPNVAELRVTAPSCESSTVAGRTLRLKVWWKLGGAIVGFPTHGIALGAGREPVWFEDATKRFVVGQPQEARVMNTPNAIVLEHTFNDNDQTSAADVFLSAWVLPDFEFSSTMYVASVEWMPAN
ncbi:MAG: hypothetical protein SFV15_23750 [Polyangiaceae bacterium]|nr:hypothetical protein [Polyangiaceae bacterium]